MNNSPQPAAKGFTRAFYVSNTVELFERMAYYAVFIVLTIYLSTILGFNDFEASMIPVFFPVDYTCFLFLPEHMPIRLVFVNQCLLPFRY